MGSKKSGYLRGELDDLKSIVDKGNNVAMMVGDLVGDFYQYLADGRRTDSNDLKYGELIEEVFKHIESTKGMSEKDIARYETVYHQLRKEFNLK